MRSNPVDKNRLEQHGRQKKEEEKIVSLALLQMVGRVLKIVPTVVFLGQLFLQLLMFSFTLA